MHIHIIKINMHVYQIKQKQIKEDDAWFYLAITVSTHIDRVSPRSKHQNFKVEQRCNSCPLIRDVAVRGWLFVGCRQR